MAVETLTFPDGLSLAEGEVRKAKETAARVCEHERDNLLYTTESENKNLTLTRGRMLLDRLRETDA